MNDRALPSPHNRRKGPLVIAIAFFVLLFASRFISSTVLDYEWWKEVPSDRHLDQPAAVRHRSHCRCRPASVRRVHSGLETWQ